MSIETPFPVLTKEQMRAVAHDALDVALVALASAKKSVEAAQEAKRAAQCIIDSAKPTIMRAEANVSIARANLLDFGPIPAVARNADDPSILDLVVKALRESPSQMTIDEILTTIGPVTNRDNLAAYLSRWSKTGCVIKGEKNSRLEPARFYAPPVTNGVVPSFLGGTPPFQPPVSPVETPSFLGGTPPAPAGFSENFPGREPLIEAGYTSPADLPRTTEELQQVKGVGKATAKAILEALGN